MRRVHSVTWGAGVKGACTAPTEGAECTGTNWLLEQSYTQRRTASVRGEPFTQTRSRNRLSAFMKEEALTPRSEAGSDFRIGDNLRSRLLYLDVIQHYHIAECLRAHLMPTHLFGYKCPPRRILDFQDFRNLSRADQDPQQDHLCKEEQQNLYLYHRKYLTKSLC